MIYKFVSWEIDPLENLKGTKVFEIYNKLQNGEKLTREEKDYIFSNLQNNAYSRTGVPVLGWMFDFSEFLKSYWVKTRNYGILEVYAFDKTSIHNYYGSYEILKIVEID